LCCSVSAPFHLTKFASLTFVQVVALTGALAAGVTTTAPAIFAGVLLADLFYHRKALTASWINASREMVALYAAYGAYAALAIRTPGARSVALVPEVVPAIAVFFLAYFLLSRAMLYATLLTRNKLLPEEQALILRYEVIVFLASMVASIAILIASRPLGDRVDRHRGRTALCGHSAAAAPGGGGVGRRTQSRSCDGHGSLSRRKSRRVVPADRGVCEQTRQLG
jgi:hypothetical protein